VEVTKTTTISVRAPGARLHVERTGRPGEALLCITGFGCGSQLFAPVLPLFSDRYDCIVYDNRAASRSSTPLLPTSMPELANDAVRVLDALGVDAAHVHGVSMGGMIAQELALRFPDRVRSLVLQGTTPGGPRSTAPAAETLLALAAQRVPLSRERKIAMLTHQLFSDAYATAHPDEVLDHLRRLGADRAGVRGALQHLTASTVHDTVSRLRSVQAPTLVLHGELDRMVSVANARLLAERIPRARLAVVDGAGHLPLLEQPLPVRTLILDWMDEQGPLLPGRPLSPVAAAAEPWTRLYGLQVGAARTWASSWRPVRHSRLGGSPRR
jgi:3-oxoadipate enol-lactonase